ncbi:MAG: hypothetical protein WEA59_02565 [Ferruginibacter sp.]
MITSTMPPHSVENKVVSSESSYPAALRWPAQFLSYILHPIFIPLYVLLFLLFLHPSYFAGFSDGMKWRSVFILVQNAIFYPLFTILLLKKVGFIDSIFLKKQKDRIIPYIAAGIFFFWTYHVFKQQPIYPSILPSFIFGIFLGSSAALIANIYFKISMHAIGMGGWLGIFLLIANSSTMLMTWPLAAVLLLTGLVCTARFIVSDHTPKEIYLGLLLGMFSQFMGAYVVM